MSKMHCFTIALSCLLARALHAQPDGFYLIEGEASAPFVDEDGCYTVKVGKSATIGWNSFLVEKGETFRFEQEDSESTVINFVTGQSQSTLSGNIQSKGKIYLNHPSKIVVTPDAVLNAPQIVLVSEQGNVQVSGTLVANEPSGKGGKIHVLGKEVDIETSAVINASAAAGGGEVLIGGSFQGKDRSIPHSLQTIVRAGAQISVDSLEYGNGGRAIIWSDGTTQYAGHASARGGPEGGDGGFVEISGKEQLGFDGTVTTEAPQGKTGELLLDPYSVGLYDKNGIPCPPGGIEFYQSFGSLPGTTVDLNFPSVINALNTSDVTIRAISHIDAYLHNTYFIPPGRTLTLRAVNRIQMNGAFTLNVGNGFFAAYVNDAESPIIPVATDLFSRVILNDACRIDIDSRARINLPLGPGGGIQLGVAPSGLKFPGRGAVFNMADLDIVFSNIQFGVDNIKINLRYVRPTAKGGPGGGPRPAVNMPKSRP